MHPSSTKGVSSAQASLGGPINNPTKAGAMTVKSAPCTPWSFPGGGVRAMGESRGFPFLAYTHTDTEIKVKMIGQVGEI
jgi:hypothetical protein